MDCALLLLLLLSHFSRVRLCATPQTAAHQAPPSLGFSRQEHWSGLPFPSPMHERESESEVAQSCPTLSDPMDCSPPGSSAHGILQARVLEWGAIAFSRLCPSKYQRRASRLPVRVLPPGKQRGSCEIARARRKGVAAILAPETASSTKLWASCQLLTIPPWDPGRFTSTRSVTPCDQLPRGDTQHTWDCALTAHPGNQATGEVHKIHGPPGTVRLPSTRSAERLAPGKGTKHTAHLSLCSCGVP